MEDEPNMSSSSSKIVFVFDLVFFLGAKIFSSSSSSFKTCVFGVALTTGVFAENNSSSKLVDFGTLGLVENISSSFFFVSLGFEKMSSDFVTDFDLDFDEKISSSSSIALLLSPLGSDLEELSLGNNSSSFLVVFRVTADGFGGDVANISSFPKRSEVGCGTLSFSGEIGGEVDKLGGEVDKLGGDVDILGGDVDILGGDLDILSIEGSGEKWRL
jgi:hypothetical protein